VVCTEREEAFDRHRQECYKENRMPGYFSLSTKNATRLPKCSKSLHSRPAFVRNRKLIV
jgi:hypothetical protein